MEIKNKADGHKGAFYMEDAGKEIGLMHYQMQGNGTMVIDHTEVDKAYEGKGLGRQLVKAGVEYARENHLKIMPLCPFAKKVFNITPDFADVLY
jgi:predicted GNAT family acetyltransferase